MTTPTPPITSTSTSACACACGTDSPLSITASIVSLLTFALGLLASYIALQSATRGAPAEVARLVDDLRATQHEINRVAEYIFDDRAGSGAHGGGGGGKERAEGTRFGGHKPAYAVVREGGGEWGGWRGAGSYTFGSRSTSASNGVRATVATATGGAGPAAASGGELYAETQALLGNCVRLFYEADRLLKQSRADAGRWDPRGLWNRVAYVMNRHEVEEKMQRLGEQKARLAAVQMGVFMREGRAQERVLGEVLGVVRELREGEGRGGWGGSGSEESGVLVERGKG